MKYVAAYLLACVGGNDSPTPKDVKKILASVGAEVDDVRLTKLMNELSGKDVNDVIAAGREKFASVPSGGGGGGGVAVAAGGGGGGGAAAAAAEEEPEKPEEEEEEDEDMGFSLFD